MAFELKKASGRPVNPLFYHSVYPRDIHCVVHTWDPKHFDTYVVKLLDLSQDELTIISNELLVNLFSKLFDLMVQFETVENFPLFSLSMIKACNDITRLCSAIACSERHILMDPKYTRWLLLLQLPWLKYKDYTEKEKAEIINSLPSMLQREEKFLPLIYFLSRCYCNYKDYKTYLKSDLDNKTYSIMYLITKPMSRNDFHKVMRLYKLTHRKHFDTYYLHYSNYYLRSPMRQLKSVKILIVKDYEAMVPYSIKWLPRENVGLTFDCKQYTYYKPDVDGLYFKIIGTGKTRVDVRDALFGLLPDVHVKNYIVNGASYIYAPKNYQLLKLSTAHPLVLKYNPAVVKENGVLQIYTTMNLVSLEKKIKNKLHRQCYIAEYEDVLQSTISNADVLSITTTAILNNYSQLVVRKMFLTKDFLMAFKSKRDLDALYIANNSRYRRDINKHYICVKVHHYISSALLATCLYNINLYHSSPALSKLTASNEDIDIHNEFTRAYLIDISNPNDWLYAPNYTVQYNEKVFYKPGDLILFNNKICHIYGIKGDVVYSSVGCINLQSVLFHKKGASWTSFVIRSLAYLIPIYTYTKSKLFQLYEGVAGCGKTYSIIHNHDSEDTLAIGGSQLRRINLEKGTYLSIEYFIYQYVLQDKMYECTTLIFDELTLLDPYYVMLTAQFCTATNILGFYDSSQIPYTIFTNHYYRPFNIISLLQNKEFKEYNYLTRRFGKQTANYLTSIGYKVESEHEDSFEFSDTKPVYADVYLVLTNDELIQSECSPINTIHRVQGKTYSIVCLILNSTVIDLVCSYQHLIVALTRHTTKLIIWNNTKLPLSLVKKSFELSKVLTDASKDNVYIVPSTSNVDFSLFEKDEFIELVDVGLKLTRQSFSILSIIWIIFTAGSLPIKILTYLGRLIASTLMGITDSLMATSDTRAYPAKLTIIPDGYSVESKYDTVSRLFSRYTNLEVSTFATYTDKDRRTTENSLLSALTSLYRSKDTGNVLVSGHKARSMSIWSQLLSFLTTGEFHKGDYLKAVNIAVLNDRNLIQWTQPYLLYHSRQLDVSVCVNKNFITDVLSNYSSVSYWKDKIKQSFMQQTKLIKYIGENSNIVQLSGAQSDIVLQSTMRCYLFYYRLDKVTDLEKFKTINSKILVKIGEVIDYVSELSTKVVSEYICNTVYFKNASFRMHYELWSTAKKYFGNGFRLLYAGWKFEHDNYYNVDDWAGAWKKEFPGDINWERLKRGASKSTDT
jgi:hypothetical protein